ncbi:MAG TPA: 1,4-alpha-glucan branching protein domain-containing protein [Candidatus Eremiobacteraceae bacterium]|nr:1,4-alpha-glucan branching protein domain-containing protein [Candidatus Eremiobacteraceae bacterium]
MSAIPAPSIIRSSARTGRADTFVLALHAHLPFVRKAGRWPFGEEWLYEAMAGTYLPLLGVFERLAHDGVAARAAVGITPVLLEQLADPYLQDGFTEYAARVAAAADVDAENAADSGQSARAALARDHARRYRELAADFTARGGDIVAGFASLAQAGRIEILTSAATHAFLPLLATESLVRAELRVGVETTRARLGVAPAGIWLPECAYRPGLERDLEELGLRYFFVDAHAVTGAEPLSASSHFGLAARAATVEQEDAASHEAATFRPHYVADSSVIAFARSVEVSRQVWARHFGYPGDPAYLEFHKRAETSGLHYWAVSGPSHDLGDKAEYDPAAASYRVREQAEHFASLVEDLAVSVADGACIVAPYDAELFGHWWFEGPAWIEAVMRRLAARGAVTPATPSEALTMVPARDALDLPATSWGEGGDFRVWSNAQTDWMWPRIHAAEFAMRDAVRSLPNADPLTKLYLNQAARELLLLSSSDWPFLITTGQAREYAEQRFSEHITRFDDCLAAAKHGGASESARRRLALYAETDNVFARIDYRIFG